MPVVSYHSLDELYKPKTSKRQFTVVYIYNREFKHDVYGRRQTAKITSEFVFFSFNP